MIKDLVMKGHVRKDDAKISHATSAEHIGIGCQRMKTEVAGDVIVMMIGEEKESGRTNTEIENMVGEIMRWIILRVMIHAILMMRMGITDGLSYLDAGMMMIKIDQ